MNDEAKLLVGVVALLISLANLVYTQFVAKVQVHERLKGTETTVAANATTLSQLGTKVWEIDRVVAGLSAQWDIVGEHMIRQLMHHDDHGRDKLIAKLLSRTLTYTEATELKALLEVDKAHPENLSEREIVGIPYALARLEQVLKQPPTTPTVVAQLVPPPPEPPPSQGE